jgi:DNA (cytosine-5)-methyltransferase 1
MENVAGLLQKKYRRLISSFKLAVKAEGYAIVEPIRLLNAADFGVPQRRKRVFILGYRVGEVPPKYPKIRSQHVSVAMAIADLKRVEKSKLVDGDGYSGKLRKPNPYVRRLRAIRVGKSNGVITGFARTEHSAKTVRRFGRVEAGDADKVSRFIRLKSSGVAPTLRAGTGFENGRFMAPRPIHPDLPRCICLREAARLHSFPDSFVFHDTKWHGFMQIGNSVPPLLAHAVATEIRRAIRKGK